MAQQDRKFRTDASLDAERVARAAIVPFLQQRGFLDVRQDLTLRGTAVTQMVTAQDPGSSLILKMHVRLCWRRDGRNAREQDYSAAQLRARLINDDWYATLDLIVGRDRREGTTHKLIAQYEQAGFVHAALVPSDQLKVIWERQRDVSEALIRGGKTGRMTKNHAMNGSSPTIYLQDDRTPHTHAVAEALWTWPGVVNVLSRPTVGPNGGGVDDTLDDLSAAQGGLGRDAADRVERISSGFPRDARVRAAVVKRAGGVCERVGCGARRDFPGFLDVHHILGVDKSDRVWNCVALCPNCHREAHFAPDRDAINAALGAYAANFRLGALGNFVRADAVTIFTGKT